MLIDARELSGDSEIVADICIVGSGPAGIAMAMEYDGLPIRVAVVEAGGQAKEQANTSRDRLGSDSQIGDFYFDLPGRQVGGNSNLWGIHAPGTTSGLRTVPLKAVDFERREWMPQSGWPVSPSYFDGYYERAKSFLGLSRRGFDGDDWADSQSPSLHLKSTRVSTAVFQFADGKLISEQYRDRLIASENVTLYTNAPVTAIRTDSEDTKVVALEIAADGKKLAARADKFILAAGALWTTQLLLASGNSGSGGLGNGGGHLGRNLSVHPLIMGGRFYPYSPEFYERMKLYDMRAMDGFPVMGHLQLTDEALREEQLLGLSFLFFAVERGAKPEFSPRQKRAIDAGARIRSARKSGLKPSLKDVLLAIAGCDGIVRRLIARLRHQSWNFDFGGWSKLPDQKTRFDGFEIFHIAEQKQGPESCVYLSDEKDALGVRRLCIRWDYSDENAAAIRRSQQVFRQELAKAGLGNFEIQSEADGRPVMVSSHANHFFGLTRMSARAEDGVVDTDCRIHGVENLYVASSSVFPTGGYANPTLTIIALAQRVADNVLADWLKAHPTAAAEINLRSTQAA